MGWGRLRLEKGRRMYGKKRHWIHRFVRFTPWWLPGALLWLITSLPARAQSSQAQNADRESGFVSIDCGYQGVPYTSNDSILWFPDRDFSGGGLPAILYQVPEGISVTSMEKTLRYFPTGLSNCYEIPIETPGRYLMRLSFWYNNYDGQGAPPIFNVSIGLTPSGTITMNTGDIQTPEFIATVNASNISICLIRIENHPLINGIEIRPLPDSSYNANLFGNEVLWRWFRLTNGGDPDVSTFRYPEDPLDRVWLADVNTIDYGSKYSISPLDLAVNSTIVEIIGASAEPNYIPQFVMQKSRLSAIPGSSLNYTFYDMENPRLYQIYLYFAELAPQKISNGSRIFDILFNNELAVKGFDVYRQAGSRKFKTVTLSVPLQQNTDTLLIEFRPDFTSEFQDPVITAMEIYQRRFEAIPTRAADVEGLREFRAGLDRAEALSEWGGDPCYPVQWFGVQCFYGAVATYVIGLDLADANLTGAFSPYIGNISNLKLLILNDNKLSGPIPTTLGQLRDLQRLQLQNNALNGTVPESLMQLGRLSQLFHAKCGERPALRPLAWTGSCGVRGSSYVYRVSLLAGGFRMSGYGRQNLYMNRRGGCGGVLSSVPRGPQLEGDPSRLVRLLTRLLGAGL